MEIYLIRHTKPLIESGICYGQADLSVCDSFDQEFEGIQDELPENINALYSSPLQRCTMLAESIIKTNSQLEKFQTDSRIMEMNFGDWELKKWDDIRRIDFDLWASDIVHQQVPGGESFYQLNIRVNSFIEDLLLAKKEIICVVTHSGVIRCFKSRFDNISLSDSLNQRVEYASIHSFIF